MTGNDRDRAASVKAGEVVAVRPLEWVDRGDGVHPRFIARTIVGDYAIDKTKGGAFAWWVPVLRGKIEEHTLDAAKAAAQADYEARIRSALVVEPVKGEPVAWLRCAVEGDAPKPCNEDDDGAFPVYRATPTASVGASVQKAVEEAAHLASLHAHHALWRGLLPYGWDAATEQFGRNLANAIAKAIKSEAPKRLAAANQSDGGKNYFFETEEEAAEAADNGRNTGGKSYYRPSDTPPAPQAVEAVSVDEVAHVIALSYARNDLEPSSKVTLALYWDDSQHAARALLAKFKMEGR